MNNPINQSPAFSRKRIARASSGALADRRHDEAMEAHSDRLDAYAETVHAELLTKLRGDVGNFIFALQHIYGRHMEQKQERVSAITSAAMGEK